MIKAVTIDFWNTLFTSSNGDLRRAYRNEAIRTALAPQQRSVSDEQLAEAVAHVYTIFERIWFGEQRTPSTDECVRIVWEHLGAEVPFAAHMDVVRAFEDSIIVGMPDPIEGATDVIPELAARYRLAIISDTAFSPGRALRAVLDHHGLLRYFTTCVFSDETGVSKPHEKAYSTALESLGAVSTESVHIGDIERTDILGARNMGMRSILFSINGTSPHYNADSEPTRADAVAVRGQDVPGILMRWNGVQ